MADKAHLKNIRNIVNNPDFDINTTLEDELIARIDEDMTYIQSTRESKSSLPNNLPILEGDDSNDEEDDKDTFLIDDDIINDPLADFKMDPSMTKSNKIAQNIFKNSGGSQKYEAADTLYSYDEDKAEHIESINRMRATLISSGVNVEDIPVVDERTPIADVNRALKRITKRYDSTLYSDTGNDIIIGLCQCLEGIFNGKRVLFGIRPDLTGWTDQYVRPHMTHFQHETSRMVADVVEKLGISRLAKIFLLLIPGAIVFMATSRNTSGHKNTDYGRAMSNLGTKK